MGRVEGRWISSHTYDVKRLRSDQAGREAPGSLSGLRNRPPGANQSRRTGSPPAETENVGDGGPTTTDDGDDMAKKDNPHRLTCAPSRPAAAVGGRCHGQPAATAPVGLRTSLATGRTTHRGGVPATLIAASSSVSGARRLAADALAAPTSRWSLWGVAFHISFPSPPCAVESARLFLSASSSSSPSSSPSHRPLPFLLLSHPSSPSPPGFLSHPGFNI